MILFKSFDEYFKMEKKTVKLDGIIFDFPGSTTT